MIRTALQEGIRLASRHWQALLVIYIFNLMLAAVAAAPVFKAIDAELSYTESAEKMAEGFDWLWYEEFRSRRNPGEDLTASLLPWQQGITTLLVNFEQYVRGNLRNDLPATLVWLGILYLLISTFLTGGVLGLFTENNSRFTLRFFFDRAGRYFSILFVILIVASLLYWLLWNVFGAGMKGLVVMVDRDATSEWIPVLIDWFSSLVLVIAAFFIHMVMDYARIIGVAREKLGIFQAVTGAISFCRRNLRKTIGLFYSTTLLAGVIVLTYGLLINLGGGISTVQLIILALVQQSFIAASIWLRMVYLGGQLSLYRGITNESGWALPAGTSSDDGEEEKVIIEAAEL